MKNPKDNNAKLNEMPIFNICGTDFHVDVNTLKLIEKDDPKNFIEFDEMWDHETHYSMIYYRHGKNWAIDIIPLEECETVLIPPLVKLDPVGMARKYGVSEETLKDKTDFEIMVDQSLYRSRLNGGILPTLAIEGRIFIVDVKEGMLRPKFDNGQERIPFAELRDFYNNDDDRYHVPFHSGNGNLQLVKPQRDMERSDNIVVVSFPHERYLDRVGFNIHIDEKPFMGLKKNGLKLHFNAEHSSWEKVVSLAKIQEKMNIYDKGVQYKKSPVPAFKAGSKKMTKGKKL